MPGNIIQSFFILLAKVVDFYYLLCIVRCFLSWIPGLLYTKPGRILCSLCDPYLNLFSRFNLRLGMLDFSPVISIGLLTLASSVLKNIAATGIISFNGILIQIVYLLWYVFSSLASLFLLICVIRLIVMLFSKTSMEYGSPWQAFDSAISGVLYKIVRPFSGRKPMSFKKALIISSIILLVILLCGNILINFLLRFIQMIPF